MIGLPPTLPRIAFRAEAGPLLAASDARDANAALRVLQVSQGLGGTIGEVTLDLLPIDVDLPSPGDPVTVSLDAGDGLTLVYTGEVDRLEPASTGLRVVALDVRARLARLDVEAAYEDATAGDIAADLLDRAGISPGTLATGPRFPRYHVRRGPRALRHLLELCRLAGAELRVDPDGALHMVEPEDGPADHTCTWGEDLLELALAAGPPAQDGVVVWGEGAASTKGAARADWLTTALDHVRATAAVTPQGPALHASAGAEGERAGHWRSGAIRTGEAAEQVARGWSALRAARPVTGHLRLIGAPGVVPGQRVAVLGLPRAHAARPLLPETLRVVGVRHRLDRAAFTTWLEL